MRAQSAALLIDSWEPAASGTAHVRLAALLAAFDGSLGGADRPSRTRRLSDDTLGDRNRRLLALHRDLIGTPLEARVACTKCGVESEFLLPVDAIRDLPGPDPDAQVKLRVGGRRYAFRLPTMADLEAAEGAGGARAARLQIIERCRVSPEGAEITELLAVRLAARFEGLDPAANIVVNVACSGCAAALAASVDVARFVARGVDRLVEGLLRDVDTLARAYGWDEERILALPSWRRRHYIELVYSTSASVRAAYGLEDPSRRPMSRAR